MLIFVLPSLPVSAQEALPTAKAIEEAAIGGRARRDAREEKLESTLMFVVRAARGAWNQVPLSQQASIESFIKDNVAGDRTTFVVIKTTNLDGLVAALRVVGSYDIKEYPQYGTVTAQVPIDAVIGIAARAEVLTIGPQERGRTNRYLPTAQEKSALAAALTNAGNVTWQGVVAHRADVAQSAGVTGSGVKVCVISNGVDTLAQRQATGALGAVTVLSGQAGSGDEGTAMLEIVYDMAPGATLAFATAYPSTPQFATNIINLRNVAGCDIIVDDITYYNEGAFQDGIVAQAVNTVTANGALYFSSAANSGNLTHSTSGTWEGDFVASGATVPAVITAADGPAVVMHSFSGVPYTTLTRATSVISLKWSDPLGASSNDYDLFVLDSTGTSILAQSFNAQTGTQDPYEVVFCSACTFPVGSRIYIVRYSGAPRALRLDTNRGRLANATTGSTYGHNAAASALSVGAVNVTAASGGAFVGGAANPVAYYSSDGPRKIFYNPNGTEITPGNVLFATNGGTTLPKVDLAASDCGSTNTPGFTPFCGTSAAAPTAAALAALYKSANPSATKAQVIAALLGSALDIEATGIDRVSGAGIPMAPSSAAPSPAAMTSPANGATLAGATQTFTWGSAAGATLYQVWVGNSVGAYDIGYYPASGTTGTSTTISGLPTDGRTLYVRLYSAIAGAYYSRDYTYKASVGAAPTPASITNPANGATLAGATQTFTWGSAAGATLYQVFVGNSLGAYDIGYYPAAGTTSTSTTISGLPTDGRTLYVRLYSAIGGTWYSNDYTYRASSSVTPTAAAMTSPANGTKLAGATQTFTWGSASGATLYQVFVGNSVGAYDIGYFPAAGTTGTSTTISGLPVDGRTLYVRLYTAIAGTWYWRDYTYTAAGSAAPAGAAMTAPSNGATLAGVTQTFMWSSASGATLYQVFVGNSPGAYDIGYYPAAGTTGTSTTIGGLPTDGRTLYVRLYTAIGGTWYFRDYSYIAAGTAGPTAASMTSPANGAKLAGAAQTFTWGSASGATLYQVFVGNSLGAYDIGYYPTAGTTGTSTTVGGLPVDGRTLYVRLYTAIGGTWYFRDYTYTAAGP